MSRGIAEVLRSLADSALDNRQKGDRLERLTQRVMQQAELYVRQYDEVYLWKEWPGRNGRPDTGIDLVARQRDGGGWTAIQCKFHQPNDRIGNPEIDAFLAASGKEGFTERLIVSTTDWGSNADATIRGQAVPVRRIDVNSWDSLGLEWDSTSPEPSEVRRAPLSTVRRHQQEALDAVNQGMAAGDRGQLIMACGTGKTFTSLKIAEQQVGVGGSVLFLVPSISLLSQTLTEWSRESGLPLRPFAVCSDVKVGRRNIDEDMSAVDLPESATTSGAKLVERMNRSAGRTPETLTVIFSTYQSLQAVHEAQASHGLADFDLIVCDEAHRTTGVTLADGDGSAFVRIHDPAYVRAAKRLYMTATPRLYDEASKTKAGESDAVLASMDDEATFGPIWHRLGFGEAVERDLLSDYKVLILGVREAVVAERFQRQWASGDVELNLDDTARLVGCWNGLAKQHLAELGAQPMRRAVAFAGNIRASIQTADKFGSVSEECALRAEADDPENSPALRVETRHVDGTFNIIERNKKLAWLKEPLPEGENVCRILSNARCLSEGVDVPALDAVLFLNPRRSVVDVVQSVGRVMRKAEGKNFGYVILPVAIPAGDTPEDALAENKRYEVIWQVLQALRAHDDRFNAEINKINFNKTSKQIIAALVPTDQELAEAAELGDIKQPLPFIGELQTAIYARIVQKVGQRTYWEAWAKDIASIADRHVTRIKALLNGPDLEVRQLFHRFLTGLRANLNDGISRDNAIEMLSQHIITKPVFDALFQGYDFTGHNPVSLVMQDMLDVLDRHGIETETASLERFYTSVANRAKGVDTAEGKQQIITQLYEKFFKNAFPKAAASLGIVYTPVEIVDFIVRAVESVLNEEFGASLNDLDVQVLDPFTGTGTFIVRLMQSGLISPDNLLRKYATQLHANEISLLAYYIAAINIEATFHALMEPDSATYSPFDGIVLVDTFQMTEATDTLDREIFVKNNARVEHQLTQTIRVIVGNPPYSAGQSSANDDNANLKYPTLDRRIEDTYTARSVVSSRKSLNDSYIRAIRWASDRIGEKGVVGFVTNGGYIDSNIADGIRRCLVDEFDTVFVFNLRGNARTKGEQRRKEKGNVFGAGSRTTIAITLLVKGAGLRKGLFYRDIGDYLTAEEKLNRIASSSISDPEWELITPNAHADWINQRGAAVGSPLADDTAALMRTSSKGLLTSRDSWVYGSSRAQTEGQVRALIEEVNQAIDDGSVKKGSQTMDPRRVKWSESLLKRAIGGKYLQFTPTDTRTAAYRPFFKQVVVLSDGLIHQPGEMASYFPSPKCQNLCIYVVGVGSDVPFGALLTDGIPDYHLTGAGSGGRCFPRWTYESVAGYDTGFSFSTDEDFVVDGYRRLDNITDSALGDYQRAYPNLRIEKDDIFYYIYGVLHSPTYRTKFAADLKKSMPRIPKVRDFPGFADAGRRLAELHVGYEEVEPYPLEEIVSRTLGDDYEQFSVSQKMQFEKVRVGGKLVPDRARIRYNPRIALVGIPEDAYLYQPGSRSAIEWIIDRYWIRRDAESGIVSDPNEWSREHHQPRYIIDLLKRIVTVSVNSIAIIDDLPELEILSGPSHG